MPPQAATHLTFSQAPVTHSPPPLPQILEKRRRKIIARFRFFLNSKAMKKSGLFAASVAAASAYSASSPSSVSPDFSPNSTIHLSREEASSKKDQQRPPTADRFAPRFDGLRFIETLVTAHR